MEKTLIIYSSKHGVCEKIAKQLSIKIGCPYQNVLYTQNIEKYSNIILLTSIYMGSSTKHMQRFIKTNLDMLLTKNVAIGIVCCCKDSEQIQSQIKTAFPAQLYDIAFFKGCLGSGVNIDKLNFMEKIVFTKLTDIEESYLNYNSEEIEQLSQSVKKLN